MGRVRTIRLQGVRNVRDLGGVPVPGGRVVRPGLIYRGAAPYDATPDDWRLLSCDLGVACVIDLRCGWECDEHPYEVPVGVEYRHVPFYDIDKVGIEYTEPSAGTKMVGRDVACDPPRFYRSLSNPLTTAQMRKALDCIFQHALCEQATFFHCSGGKDRAGVLAALVLGILGVGAEDVLDDYLLTNVSRDKEYDRMLQRFLLLADGDELQARELVDSHRALPANLDAFYQGVLERTGSLDAFVSQHLGITEDMRGRLWEACTIPAWS